MIIPIPEAPTISDVDNRVMDEDTPAEVSFTVDDAESAAGALTLSATASNAALFGEGSIVFGGGGATRTATLVPLPNQSGVSNITLQVADVSGMMSSESFSVTVNAVNDIPAIRGEFRDLILNRDVPVAPIAFTVGDVETDANSLVVTGRSSNTTLVAEANVIISGSGAQHTISVTPAPGAIGTTTITLDVTDTDGGMTSESFTLRITDNELPQISQIDDLFFAQNQPGEVLFQISDLENAASDLTMSVSSSNAQLLPADNIAISGVDAGRMLLMTPLPDAVGSTTVAVIVEDLAGGRSSESFTVSFDEIPPGPATLFWQGDDTTNPGLWSVAANWSTEFDGTGTDQAPSSGAVLVFDANTLGLRNFSSTNNVEELTDIEIQFVDDFAENQFAISGNAIELSASGITQTRVKAVVSTPLILTEPTTVHVGSDLTLDGPITGRGGVTKTGSGVLTLANRGNNYFGATRVIAGTVRTGDSEVIPNFSAVDLAAGTFLDLNGFFERATLFGLGTVINNGERPASIDFFQTPVFDGVIQDGNDVVRVSFGNGNLTTQTTILTGTHTYTGTTLVANNATLILDGRIGPSLPVTVGFNTDRATLGGSGIIDADVLVKTKLSPGNASADKLTTNNLLFESEGIYIVDLLGSEAGQFDQTVVNGSATLGSATLTLAMGDGYVPAVGDSFKIITTTDGVIGEFAGLSNGDTFVVSGVAMTISYDQDVSLVVRPLHAGDANGDGEFNTDDIILVLAGNKFESNQPATWQQGDFNRDGVFGTRDIIEALALGEYEQGPYRAAKAKRDLDSVGVDAVLGTLDQESRQRQPVLNRHDLPQENNTVDGGGRTGSTRWPALQRFPNRNYDGVKLWENKWRRRPADSEWISLPGFEATLEEIALDVFRSYEDSGDRPR